MLWLQVGKCKVSGISAAVIGKCKPELNNGGTLSAAVCSYLLQHPTALCVLGKLIFGCVNEYKTTHSTSGWFKIRFCKRWHGCLKMETKALNACGKYQIVSTSEEFERIQNLRSCVMW